MKLTTCADEGGSDIEELLNASRFVNPKDLPGVGMVRGVHWTLDNGEHPGIPRSASREVHSRRSVVTGIARQLGELLKNQREP